MNGVSWWLATTAAIASATSTCTTDHATGPSRTRRPSVATHRRWTPSAGLGATSRADGPSECGSSLRRMTVSRTPAMQSISHVPRVCGAR